MNKRKACKISGLKYPASDNVKSRTSTIARAMASTLAPRIPCSSEMEEEWLRIFGSDDGDLKCAYCGAKATHLDHLHPLIVDTRPTGFGTEPGNLVPCCNSCNQKKRNMEWKEYMNNYCNYEGKEERKKKIEELEESPLKAIPNERFKEEGFCKDWDRIYYECVKALNNAQTVLEKYKE